MLPSLRGVPKERYVSEMQVRRLLYFKYLKHCTYTATACGAYAKYVRVCTLSVVFRRPVVVCICSCFPDTPIAVDTRVIILQHPNEVISVECMMLYHCVCVCVCVRACVRACVCMCVCASQEGRRLATVPLLQECIARDRLHIVRGKRFAVGR